MLPVRFRGRVPRRTLHTLGVDHRAVEFDDDGIDVVQAIIDLHGLFRTQHERSLGQAVGTRGIRSDHRGAAYFARGVAGMRIDDVVIAHAVFLEEAFVIARGRNGRIDQGYPRNHLSLALARIADPDHPGLAEPITDDAAVAAGRDISLRDAKGFQYVDAAVHGVTLGNAAEID